MRRNLFPLVVAIVLGTTLTVPHARPQEPTTGFAVVKAKATVTPPKEHFGFNMGDDYCLANYKQFESYLQEDRRARPTGSRW